MQVKQPPTRAQRSAGFVARGERRALPLLICFVLLALPLVAVHLPFLTLPFFWDELGQFIPTALDLLRSGSWIAHSTTPNVHPPGVEVYLVLWYKLFGDSSQPGNTRSSRLPPAFVAADFPAFLHPEHDGAVGHARHGVHAARPAALLAKGIRSSFGCVPRAGAGKGDRTGCALCLWGASGRKERLEARQLLCPARRGAWPMVMAARSSNRLLAGESRLRSL